MVIDSAGEMEDTAGTSSKGGFNIRNKASKLSEEKEQKWDEKSGNIGSQALQSVSPIPKGPSCL